MPITEQDIKLLQSARLTDTPDGGGRMTGNVVQSGVDNNIFDDVSNLDRVYGNVSMRKVFPAVLTNTTDKYLGARVIIDEPPADENIEGVLFEASSLFDTREQAKIKVEGYLSRGVSAFYYLFGDHIAGQGAVMLASVEERDTPAIGMVFVLYAETAKDSGVFNEQFVRVTVSTSTVVQFTGGGEKKYKLRLSTCDVSDPLRYNFQGWGALEDGMVTSAMLADPANVTRTVVHNSVVADAAQYFGIRPLATAANTGAFNIKADSSFSALVPSAQIEAPLAAVLATGRLASPEPLGAAPIVFTSSSPFNTTQQLFIGASVEKGSLSITWGGADTLADNSGGGLTINGVEVGSIDYANGILSMASAAYPDLSSATKTITYSLANMPTLALRSMGILVDTSTRTLNYVQTFANKPGKGTTSVSYLSGGRWYVLTDDGTGALRGSSSGEGAGTVNYAMATVSVTLGALPDVGSQIIFQYGNGFSATSAKAIAPEDFPRGARLYANIAPLTGVLSPELVTVAWTDGGAKSATCTWGVSSGDGLFYAPSGVEGFSPDVLPPKNTVFSVTGKVTTRTNTVVADVRSFTLDPVAPGTLLLEGVQMSLLWTVTPEAGGRAYIQAGYNGSVTTGADWRTATTTVSTRVYDDKNGVLMCDYRTPFGSFVQAVGSIVYATGAVSITASLAGAATSPGPGVWYTQPGGGFGATLTWAAFPQARRSLTMSFGLQGGTVKAVQTPNAPTTVAVTLAELALHLPALPTGAVPSGMTFTLGSTIYQQDPAAPSTVRKDVNPTTGIGTAAGSLANEVVTLTSWPSADSTATALAYGSVVPITSPQANWASEEVTFRCAGAPIRPGSFSVQGAFGGTSITFNVTANTNGHIVSATGGANRYVLRGVVDYETGVCTLSAQDTYEYVNQTPYDAAPASVKAALGPLDYHPWTIRTDDLRYNAVAYTYLPLDANVLGLDPVRLPSDGRVPIFKSGRVVVIHNTVKMSPQTVTNSQTVDCGRTRLARIRVFGNDGLEIASGFTKNLDAGTITFTNVAGYSQPVTIEHRIEDEALCAEAQITGDLRLTRPLTHDFPADTSYVSSALVKGTLQAAAQDSFAQEAWTSVWSDSRIGNPILAQYNDTANPLVVTNAGAITERWLIQFTSNTAFNLVGEEVGQIITGDTATTLSPVNPATGVPYFVLQPAGWGAGWVAGNCLRFNTSGANFPLWVARTVRQSPSAPPGTDQMTISIRGDIDQ